MKLYPYESRNKNGGNREQGIGNRETVIGKRESEVRKQRRGRVIPMVLFSQCLAIERESVIGSQKKENGDLRTRSIPHRAVQAQYYAHPQSDDEDDCTAYGDQNFVPAIDFSQLSHEVTH